MMRPQKLPVASPRGGNRGCLCKDNTYSRKCCDGSLQAQGIGSLVGQGISVKIRGEEWQTINTRWEATNTLWQDL
jgi:hypothetical protein